MPCRNEADRYLDSVLAWTSQFTDGIVVYDNRSEDNSVEIAEKRGALVKVRPFERPGFMDHEGQFRQDAWAWMEEALHPEPDDWIFAVDADEFLVASSGFPDHDVPRLVKDGVAGSPYESILLDVPEVFDVIGGKPYVRVDGAWATIRSPRLFAYKPGAKFADKQLASGSEPTYVAATQPIVAPSIALMHFGYAVAEDREAKYRLWSHATTPSHSDAHVQSILSEPTLVPWPQSVPEVWRGRR